ncbi:hypothetical protein [Desulforegula conservatrix]|uniref:hypothetical protein n=1 Tax=Desulforegula conservatrix TaxID=153026 RepID=UPI0003F5DAFF|nr:hypothetical protein [Desulforegula conservatrix]
MDQKLMEIFSAGTHTDKNGKSREWTDADLANMAEKYNAQKDHEAPLVIGHPAENAPAWGWVESLKAEGSRLFAKCRQVAPEFAEMVNSGMFKKRSISLYPDMLLRHVGFLGAQPPAVKGLKDFAFSGSEECPEYEFQETNMSVEALEKKLAESEAARLEAEKTTNAVKAELARQNAEFSENQKKTRRKEIDELISAGIKAGKILPAWEKQGLAEFMAALDENEATYEFSEGKKVSPGVWFREFIEGFSAHPLFKTMAKPEEKADADKQEYSEDMKLADEIAARVTGGK